MSLHEQTALLDPFTGREVGIDNELVPAIRALWALGIETTGSCQGTPGIDRALICFAEPRGYEASPDFWTPDCDCDKCDDCAAWSADIEAWNASRPDGARQVVSILVGGPWAHMTARWLWTFGDDPGNVNSGSALLLPTADLPVLARALTIRPARARQPRAKGEIRHRVADFGTTPRR